MEMMRDRESNPVGGGGGCMGGSICLKQSSPSQVYSSHVRRNVFLTPIDSELHFIRRPAIHFSPPPAPPLPPTPPLPVLAPSLFIASHQPWGNGPAAAVMPLTANAP